MEDAPAPYSPQLRAVLQDLNREVRQFDIRLVEANLTDDVRALCDRLYDLEAESAAQRTEIARLHTRLHRLEDELGQGRGWLVLLADRTTALEEATQKLAIKDLVLTMDVSEAFGGDAPALPSSRVADSDAEEAFEPRSKLRRASSGDQSWQLIEQNQPVPENASFHGWGTTGASPQLLGSVSLSLATPRPVQPSTTALRAPSELHPPAFREPIAGLVTSKDNHQACDERNKVLFDQLCASHGAYSEVLQQLSGSREGAVIKSRLLSKVSDTTAARYLRSVQLFFCAFEELGGNMESIDQGLFLDAFFALSRGSEPGPLSNSINVLKALRWYKKLLSLACLPDLYGTAFSLLSNPSGQEKRESIPLPLSFVAFLERTLLSGTASLMDTIWAGSFLVAIGASLRFADAQHVRWSSLCVSHFTLRGICYRTKTTKGGCPFGLLSFGPFSSAEEWGLTWLPRWLGALDKVWSDLRSRFGAQPEPDCMFFLLSDAGFAPATYSQALQKLRHWLTLSGIEKHQASQYTLHSLKTTFLSWMSQLSIPLASRFLQGHHKTPGSAQLYSRDDVWPALRTQLLLWRSIHSGFRPARPQHRGGQSPLAEPPFETAGFQWDAFIPDLTCFSLGSDFQSFLALEQQVDHFEDSDADDAGPARPSAMVASTLEEQPLEAPSFQTSRTNCREVRMPNARFDVTPLVDASQNFPLLRICRLLRGPLFEANGRRPASSFHNAGTRFGSSTFASSTVIDPIGDSIAAEDYGTPAAFTSSPSPAAPTLEARAEPKAATGGESAPTGATSAAQGDEANAEATGDGVTNAKRWQREPEVKEPPPRPPSSPALASTTPKAGVPLLKSKSMATPAPPASVATTPPAATPSAPPASKAPPPPLVEEGTTGGSSGNTGQQPPASTPQREIAPLLASDAPASRLGRLSMIAKAGPLCSWFNCGHAAASVPNALREATSQWNHGQDEWGQSQTAWEDSPAWSSWNWSGLFDMSDFSQLVSDCNVPLAVASLLSAFDTALYARACTTSSELEELITHFMTEAAVTEAAERFITKASLRLLFFKCRQSEGMASLEATPSAALPLGEAPSTAVPTAPAAVPLSSSWQEAWPAKLSGERTAALRKRFEEDYPTELLDAESFPSARLLALTNKMLSEKEVRWIPWKYRLSARAQEDSLLIRPKKQARFDLAEFFFDEGAHLGSLKLYNKKFTRICFTKYEASANLRGPTTMEAQAADRRCWEIIADLVNVHHWKLDDALHEVAEVRSDLHSLLAPRPFIPKPKHDPDNSWKAGAKGNGRGGKGGGRGGKGRDGKGEKGERFERGGKGGKGKDNKQATPPGKWLSTIFMDGKRQTLCMRYQSGQCKDPATCRYVHRCAVPKNETHFSDQRDIAEEVTVVPLSVPAQPSGSAGATSALPKAGAPVSSASLAISEGSLDFATCLELLAQYFSIPFIDAAGPTDNAIDASGAYFNLGAFSFDNGTRSGIFQRTEQFSDVLRFLNAFMQLQFPGASWSSLCVSHNVRTRLHTDAGNASGTLNHTVSLGNFSGGEIWISPALDPSAANIPAPLEASSEAYRAEDASKGELRDTWHSPLSFSCESLHCTMPIQGDRWVLTAYTCRNLHSFDTKSLAHLRSLGFPLPPVPTTLPQAVPSAPKDNTHVEIFLDICCGASHPLTTAISSCGIICLPIDLLGEEQLDLLHDDTYDHLLRLCFSGIVRFAHGSPPCKEYSRLKLRPGGPAAIRSPEHLNGLPGNTASQQERVVSSQKLLYRCVCLLRAAFNSGAHVSLEQPTNAMSWLEPFVQDMLAEIQASLVNIPACSVGQNIAKSWLLACSFDDMRALAGTCSHSEGHPSVAGVRDELGNFLSQRTAEYPAQLANRFAQQAAKLFSSRRPSHSVPTCSLAFALSSIPKKPRAATPTASQDGGGIYSLPDWSMGPRYQSDSLHDLRKEWQSWLLSHRWRNAFGTDLSAANSLTNFSVSSSGIHTYLDDKLRFTGKPPGTSISEGSTLLSARHKTLHSKADLALVPVSTKRMWLRVTDPTSSKRRLSESSRETLSFFAHLSSRDWRPRPLRPPPMSSVESAADAFGKGNDCGVGGWLLLPCGRLLWFSHRYTVQDFLELGLPMQPDANLDISSYETLAQCYVLLAFWKAHGSGRLALKLPALSDNSGAESVCNKLYTSKVPLNLFVRKLSMWSSITGVTLDCSHIAGEKNDDADLLSRWDGCAELPAKFLPSNRIELYLSEFWQIRFQVTLFPADTFLKWQLPSATRLGPTNRGSNKRK
ncbi:unnamed protein product [Symbiodinium sp. CCMP2592]|nr:unnamed protein product [Symbiodinium sp. CCMP2592]